MKLVVRLFVGGRDNMRPTRDAWAMDLAKVTATRATCLRRAVGCVLLNARGHELAFGYNGVHAEAKHCNEEVIFKAGIIGRLPYEVVTHPHACPGAKSPSGTNLDGCQAIHAEQNALLKCKDVYDIHSCYTTTSPCMTCVKLLLNTSCERIVFLEEYPHTEAKQLWEGAGREWVKFIEEK